MPGIFAFCIILSWDTSALLQSYSQKLQTQLQNLSQKQQPFNLASLGFSHKK